MSGLGDMGNLLKQAQEMQRQVDRVRAELRKKVVTGTSAGGAVRVELTADRKEVKAVHIAPEALAGNDTQVLAERVRAALEEAIRRGAETEREEIGRITGGLQLPGLF